MFQSPTISKMWFSYLLNSSRMCLNHQVNRSILRSVSIRKEADCLSIGLLRVAEFFNQLRNCRRICFSHRTNSNTLRFIYHSNSHTLRSSHHNNSRRILFRNLTNNSKMMFNHCTCAGQQPRP